MKTGPGHNASGPVSLKLNANGGIILINRCILWLCPKLAKHYTFIMVFIMLAFFTAFDVSAGSTTPAPPGGDDIWGKANSLIVDIYTSIVGISTVLVGLMSAIAVIGAKMSNNQHKVDQAWDWCATRS